MDLLGEHPALNIKDESWRIYSRHKTLAPQYVGENAVIENSSITEGCEIYGKISNSVLGSGVKVMTGACVVDSVIMDDCTIGEGATVSYAILDSGVSVGKGASIGKCKTEAKGITVIGTGISVPDGFKVDDDKMISNSSDLVKEA